MQKVVPIGQAAERTGVKAPTIRYYEQIGLLPEPPRTVGNRRQYSDAEIGRLAFIRHARELGFEVDAIRTLLELQDKPNQSCAEADAIARARLIEVEHRIESLVALRSELERMIEACACGRVAECQIIETLGTTCSIMAGLPINDASGR